MIEAVCAGQLVVARPDRVPRGRRRTRARAQEILSVWPAATLNSSWITQRGRVATSTRRRSTGIRQEPERGGLQRWRHDAPGQTAIRRSLWTIMSTPPPSARTTLPLALRTSTGMKTPVRRLAYDPHLDPQLSVGGKGGAADRRRARALDPRARGTVGAEDRRVCPAPGLQQPLFDVTRSTLPRPSSSTSTT